MEAGFCKRRSVADIYSADHEEDLYVISRHTSREDEANLERDSIYDNQGSAHTYSETEARQHHRRVIYKTRDIYASKRYSSQPNNTSQCYIVQGETANLPRKYPVRIIANQHPELPNKSIDNIYSESNSNFPIHPMYNQECDEAKIYIGRETICPNAESNKNNQDIAIESQEICTGREDMHEWIPKDPQILNIARNQDSQRKKVKYLTQQTRKKQKRKEKEKVVKEKEDILEITMEIGNTSLLQAKTKGILKEPKTIKSTGKNQNNSDSSRENNVKEEQLEQNKQFKVSLKCKKKEAEFLKKIGKLEEHDRIMKSMKIQDLEENTIGNKTGAEKLDENEDKLGTLEDKKKSAMLEALMLEQASSSSIPPMNRQTKSSHINAQKHISRSRSYTTESEEGENKNSTLMCNNYVEKPTQQIEKQNIIRRGFPCSKKRLYYPAMNQKMKYGHREESVVPNYTDTRNEHTGTKESYKNTRASDYCTQSNILECGYETAMHENHSNESSSAGFDKATKYKKDTQKIPVERKSRRDAKGIPFQDLYKNNSNIFNETFEKTGVRRVVIRKRSEPIGIRSSSVNQSNTQGKPKKRGGGCCGGKKREAEKRKIEDPIEQTDAQEKPSVVEEEKEVVPNNENQLQSSLITSKYESEISNIARNPEGIPSVGVEMKLSNFAKDAENADSLKTSSKENGAGVELTLGTQGKTIKNSETLPDGNGVEMRLSSITGRTENSEIFQRKSLEGTGIEMKLSSITDKTQNSEIFQRKSLEGTGVEMKLSTITGRTENSDLLQRQSLEGTGVEARLSSKSGKTENSDVLQRKSLDGTGVEARLSSKTGKTDNSDLLQRQSLDGTGVETTLSSKSRKTGNSDLLQRKSIEGTGVEARLSSKTGKTDNSDLLQRQSLDGTGVEARLSSKSGKTGNSDLLQRKSLDGTGVEARLSSKTGKTDNSDLLQRQSLEGTGVEMTVSSKTGKTKISGILGNLLSGQNESGWENEKNAGIFQQNTSSHLNGTGVEIKLDDIKVSDSENNFNGSGVEMKHSTAERVTESEEQFADVKRNSSVAHKQGAIVERRQGTKSTENGNENILEPGKKLNNAADEDATTDDATLSLLNNPEIQNQPSYKAPKKNGLFSCKKKQTETKSEAQGNNFERQNIKQEEAPILQNNKNKKEEGGCCKKKDTKKKNPQGKAPTVTETVTKQEAKQLAQEPTEESSSDTFLESGTHVVILDSIEIEVGVQPSEAPKKMKRLESYHSEEDISMDLGVIAPKEAEEVIAKQDAQPLYYEEPEEEEWNIPEPEPEPEPKPKPAPKAPSPKKKGCCKGGDKKNAKTGKTKQQNKSNQEYDEYRKLIAVAQLQSNGNNIMNQQKRSISHKTSYIKAQIAQLVKQKKGAYHADNVKENARQLHVNTHAAVKPVGDSISRTKKFTDTKTRNMRTQDTNTSRDQEESSLVDCVDNIDTISQVDMSQSESSQCFLAKQDRQTRKSAYSLYDDRSTSTDCTTQRGNKMIKQLKYFSFRQCYDKHLKHEIRDYKKSKMQPNNNCSGNKKHKTKEAEPETAAAAETPGEQSEVDRSQDTRDGPSEHLSREPLQHNSTPGFEDQKKPRHNISYKEGESRTKKQSEYEQENYGEKINNQQRREQRQSHERFSGHDESSEKIETRKSSKIHENNTVSEERGGSNEISEEVESIIVPSKGAKQNLAAEYQTQMEPRISSGKFQEREIRLSSRKGHDVRRSSGKSTDSEKHRKPTEGVIKSDHIKKRQSVEATKQDEQQESNRQQKKKNNERTVKTNAESAPRDSYSQKQSPVPQDRKTSMEARKSSEKFQETKIRQPPRRSTEVRRSNGKTSESTCSSDVHLVKNTRMSETNQIKNQPRQSYSQEKQRKSETMSSKKSKSEYKQHASPETAAEANGKTSESTCSSEVVKNTRMSESNQVKNQPRQSYSQEKQRKSETMSSKKSKSEYKQHASPETAAVANGKTSESSSEVVKNTRMSESNQIKNQPRQSYSQEKQRKSETMSSKKSKSEYKQHASPETDTKGDPVPHTSHVKNERKKSDYERKSLSKNDTKEDKKSSSSDIEVIIKGLKHNEVDMERLRLLIKDAIIQTRKTKGQKSAADVKSSTMNTGTSDKQCGCVCLDVYGNKCPPKYVVLEKGHERGRCDNSRDQNKNTQDDACVAQENFCYRVCVGCDKNTREMQAKNRICMCN